MMCKSKICVGVFAVILILAATVLMGFTGQDNGVNPADNAVKSQVGQAASSAGPLAAGLQKTAAAQPDHVQTYVYWPIWRSGS